MEKKSTYSIEYPLNISAHKKRKVTSAIQNSAKENEKNLKASEMMLKDVSSEYLPKKKLKIVRPPAPLTKALVCFPATAWK